MNVNTPEQRRKLKNWFDKAVSKAGDTYTDIMYIGTILHYDSLLNNVLQNPRYKTKKYRAVISEAVNTKLWDEWESIYTNLFNENHEEDARTFYEAHKEKMLLGAEVLWEEKLSYYDLMEIKGFRMTRLTRRVQHSILNGSIITNRSSWTSQVRSSSL